MGRLWLLLFLLLSIEQSRAQESPREPIDALEVVPPAPAEDSFDAFLRCCAEKSSNEVILKSLAVLDCQYAAKRVHEAALDTALEYERQDGYVQILRRLGKDTLPRHGTDVADAAAEVALSAIRRHLHSVAIYDTYRGYVDCDSAGGFGSSSDENKRFRGPRSIAVKLEALRALEEVSAFCEDGFLVTQTEVSQLVHDFNPTEVTSGRSDWCIAGHPGWAMWDVSGFTLPIPFRRALGSFRGSGNR